MARLSQAISEGDGISVIPLLDSNPDELGARARDAGAEAIAVTTIDAVERTRGLDLPVVLRETGGTSGPTEVMAAGGDAFVLAYGNAASDGQLVEELYAEAVDCGLDCVVDVRDEDELEEALERLDPEVLLISERDADTGGEQLERVLDLLPDVPAGKLVIAESGRVTREQVVALERAGVDAVLVSDVAGAELAETLEGLVGRPIEPR